MNGFSFGAQLSGREMRNNLGILAVAGGLGLLGGFISSRGNPALMAVFVGLVGALFVMSSRAASFWFIVVCAFLLAGISQLYLPGAAYIRYGAPLASAGLLLHLILDLLSGNREKHRTGTPILMLWAGGFALTAIVSTVVNVSDFGVAIEGFKNYFQMWAFFIAIVFTRWRPGFIQAWPKAFLLIALVQLPFVVHQYLFLVPKRVGLGGGIVPVDIVAGTFGASLYGGGANAILAAFMIIVVGCLLALWKNGVMTANKVMPLSAALLSPLLVNEAKIAALYLPLAFLVIFRKEIVVNPLRFLVAGGVMAGALAILLTALMLSQPNGRVKTFSDLVNHVVSDQSADIHERRGRYDELTRVTALKFWVTEHVGANPIHVLLGHGLGASRVQVSGFDIGRSLAEKRYGGIRIAPSTVAALLWDTGIVGLTTVLGMFVSAFSVAGWLARHYAGRDNVRAGLFEGLQAGVAILTLSLAHKDSFVDYIPYQSLVYLILGVIAFSYLQVMRGENHSGCADG